MKRTRLLALFVPTALTALSAQAGYRDMGRDLEDYRPNAFYRANATPQEPARAEAVTNYLQRSADIPQTITAEGRADNEPLVPNDSPANRATNRRVEIILEK